MTAPARPTPVHPVPRLRALRHPVPRLRVPSRTRRAASAVLAAGTAALVVAAPAAGSGAARAALPEGDVVVTNTETVQARLDATGRLREARVYEQLSLTGHGTVEVLNPVSDQGLRDLDGFGGYDVSDGMLRAEVSVDGERRLRTVSDFTDDLPLGVEVEYRLDGTEVTPGGVVGRSGTLEVRYTVTNLTARQDTVTYDDGTGTQVSTTAETVVPMIGQLVTTLPPTFTAVSSDEASMAGDGRGGTRMTFQMTLFPPIGSPTAEFGYTAQIRAGVVPPATMTALPVSPLTSPSFKGGSASYASGAASGVDLTAGAVQIDANLLALHDGAASLLEGLVQLRDGAAELSAGLAGSAAPGAQTLADGLRTADAGAASLAGGARRLADGSAQLDAGLASAEGAVPQLLGGLTQVDGGLAKIDAGLAQLAGPAGLGRMATGIGSASTPGTLLHGIDQLRTKVAAAVAGLTTLQTAAGAAAGQVTAAGDLRAVSTSITTLTAGDPGMAAATRTDLDAIAADLTTRAARLEAATAYLAGVTGGLANLRNALDPAAGSALVAIGCGLSAGAYPGMCDPARPGLLEGLTTAIASVGSPTATPADQAGQTLRGGLNLTRGGVGQVSAGGQGLLAGLSRLSDGAGVLSAGTTELVTGSTALSGGTTRLTTGADELAEGLQSAADGSTELASGLTTAADGAPALVDGTARLSAEGTSVLVENGKQTAQDYGVKYAVIEAGAERAAQEGMAFGAPDGAAAATAYSIEIAGADGSGAQNVARGLGSLALFGLGGALTALIRRRSA
ncbi:hypothetical protein [Actinotalea subterranea]|uniref:hypothetical protein n=1 Tax=Actinotalea subterranea TaxID=2607497 RepID=UPI0011EFB288|nr:hypothetical protein [Actinotalea subterranea]